MKKLIIFIFLGLFSSGFAQTNCATSNDAKCISSHKNFGLLPTTCGNDMSGSKIISGTETQLDEYPWLALLEYRKNGKSTGYKCGGVLISDRYVLTAAHCVFEENTARAGELFRVRLGEHNLKTDPDCESFDATFCTEPLQDIEVEEIIQNSNYTKGVQYNDIALVRLAKPATFAVNVQPICLPLNGEESAPGDRLYLSGWGKTATSVMSDIKERHLVNVVDLETCNNKYKTAKVNLLQSQFCAQGREELCKGNGGGPLMKQLARFYVEGILSFGPRMCSPTWPEVYTKVSYYLIWILDNLKP